MDGKIKFTFVVDLCNEGVDIPEVNTILFLRPTESATVFLQQLGRGLRLHKDEARTEYYAGKVNNKFQQFADDYGFKNHPCITGRPQTKAKL